MFTPYQTRDMLAQSLSVADIHVISLQPALEGLIVPSTKQRLNVSMDRFA
jgi:colanic acid biosynthesis glycosyl transferase WcaI